MSPSSSGRRRFLQQSSAGLAALAGGLSGSVSLASEPGGQQPETPSRRPVKHSVCKWCYRGISLEELCQAAEGLGLSSIELLKPSDMALLKRHNLTCAIITAPRGKGPNDVAVGGITRAWNRPEFHDALVAAYEPYIQESHDAGAKNVICFSGNRDGMDDEVGLKNCAAGLKRLMPLCEKLGMTLSMELLNSKVNHKDYMCDHTEWGVRLCEAVGSDSFKLLYDIYHMQIMEGDVIATIGKHHSYISHYHTGGVPGRAEIDQTQELYYPAIMRAIMATGYTGFVGQEFIPKGSDPLASLKQGIEICTV